MSEDQISNGMRIKYSKQDHLLVSQKIYSDGAKMVRIILDTKDMNFKLVDPVTGFVFDTGGEVTNLEVLQRKAKRHLQRLLNFNFDKEKRHVSGD